METSNNSNMELATVLYKEEEDAKKPKHPLAVPDVLFEIFAYFETSKAALCTFRQVSKTWNQVACKYVKKNLRWKLRPAEPGKGLREFKEIMSGCKDDLFANFNLAHTNYPHAGELPQAVTDLPTNDWNSYKIQSLDEQGLIDDFIDTYGDGIIDLKIDGFDPSHVNTYLGSLPNLESLHIYNMAFTAKKVAYKEIFFPHLKSVTFVLRGSDLEEPLPNAKVCCNIIDNSPVLTELVIKVSGRVASHILNHAESLGQLTSLIIGPYYRHPCALSHSDLRIIKKRCKRLKVLCAPVNQFSNEEFLYKVITKLAERLEVLELTCNNRSVASIDDGVSDPNSDSDDGDGAGNHAQAQPQPPRRQQLPAHGRRRPHRLGDVIAHGLGLDQHGAAPPPAPLPPGRQPQPQPLHRRPRRPGPLAEEERRFTLPNCLTLKKLSLVNWQLYNSYNFIMPTLSFLNLDLVACDLPMLAPDLPHQSLQILRYGSQRATVELITFFGSTFPNLLELQIQVENDGALREIFSCWPHLKRLYLGDSLITDEGITGIRLTDLNAHSPHSITKCTEEEMLAMRQFPFIGDLKELQHFTIERNSLSKYSVHFGFVMLKELTYIRVPPYYDRGDNYLHKHTVHARSLVDSCPALVKIDVNGFSVMSTFGETHTDNDDEHGPAQREYQGCGLGDDEIKYLKKVAPRLEIVYGEEISISQLERENSCTNGYNYFDDD